METLPEQLRKIAIAHLGKETFAYLKHLEAVAEAANQVIKDPNFDCVDNSNKLKTALARLEHFAVSVLE